MLNHKIIQGILLIGILIFSAYIDIKTREVPNFILISIILIALLDIKKIYIIGIISGLPFLIGAVVNDGGIGGGDIKIVSCVGLILGLVGTFISLILSTFLMLIFAFTIKIKIGKNVGRIKLPMLPFLNIGFIVVYVIQNI